MPKIGDKVIALRSCDCGCGLEKGSIHTIAGIFGNCIYIPGSSLGFPFISKVGEYYFELLESPQLHFDFEE